MPPTRRIRQVRWVFKNEIVRSHESDARDSGRGGVWIPHDSALEPRRLCIVTPRCRLAVVEVEGNGGEPGGRYSVGHVADVRDHPIPLVQNDHRADPPSTK